MKEMLKNKTMIGFIIIVMCVSYMNGVSERKEIQETPVSSNEVVSQAS